ncbi:uncharacterized protein LOC106731064 [Camelus ferus]|uniref:Uncharacterized protein LOC106731064 n=2 Tax=Camelus TaxID=9836 RepID=A0A8B8TPA4_CAMFR|nr:uncharacterized protein LOC106731064 [Camelus ferus]
MAGPVESTYPTMKVKVASVLQKVQRDPWHLVRPQNPSRQAQLRQDPGQRSCHSRPTCAHREEQEAGPGPAGLRAAWLRGGRRAVLRFQGCHAPTPPLPERDSLGLRYALSGRALPLPPPAFCCSRTRRSRSQEGSCTATVPLAPAAASKPRPPHFAGSSSGVGVPVSGFSGLRGPGSEQVGGTQPGASPLDQGDCVRRRTSETPAWTPRAQRQRQCPPPLVGSPWVSELELSALQSKMAVQEEEMQVQASDMESLTRNMQIREDLIKDLQMQLVDPEHIPAMERLTQEVLLLREKSCFSRITGSGSFQKPKTTIAADAGRSGR